MLSVVTWKWTTPGYRTHFTADHVNTLFRMVRRHYSAPMRAICVTNDSAGIDPDIKILPDREHFAWVKSPHGIGNPTCYRRLRAFQPTAGDVFGDRFVSLDLDCVITGDLRPLWDRDEDFVIWRDPLHPAAYCGSMFLLRAGSRPQVWAEFDTVESPRAAQKAGWKGSDQAWIRHRLPGEATWSAADGVLSWRKLNGALPAGARIVMFHGSVKPWQAGLAEWVLEHWR